MRALIVFRWVLQVFVGGILAVTAVGKALDVPGFVQVVVSYQTIPEVLAWPVAAGVIAAEAAAAMFLLSGRRLVWAGLASVVMHAGYASLAAWTLHRGLELDNCGCFGVFLARPLSNTTVYEDVVMTGVSVLIVVLALVTGRGRK